MLKDFSNTFPEYSFMWSKWMGNIITETEVESLYNYCCTIYPEFFFDILYNNEDIFDIHYEKSTCFLPCVDFKSLYNCEGISESTKKTIWNYLQLILMIIIQSIQSKENFGDITQQLFSGVNEENLYGKIKETIENLSNFFDMPSTEKESKDNLPGEENGNAKRGGGDDDATEAGNEEDKDEEEDDGNPFSSFFSKKKMPDIKEIYDHLSTLFNGKIGGLAKELAEEISKDMNDMFGSENENGESIKNSKDVIQQLLKNPEKMTNIIKNINDKLQTKIKSGEVSQEELMKEATDILGKMKNMGDMKEFKQMFKTFSKMSGMGGGSSKNINFDFNALENMTKKSSLREKMKKKLMDKQLAAAATATASAAPTLSSQEKSANIIPTEDPHHFKFVMEGEENIEKTPASTSTKKNKKKKKKISNVHIEE
jgi:hypothetical protein